MLLFGDNDAVHIRFIQTFGICEEFFTYGTGKVEYVTCDDCGIIISGSDKELPLGDHIMENTVDEEFLKTGATCKDKAVFSRATSSLYH